MLLKLKSVRLPDSWPTETLQNPEDKTRDISNCILSYLSTPPLGQDMTQGQFFKRSLTGFNSEFSFS